MNYESICIAVAFGLLLLLCYQKVRTVLNASLSSSIDQIAQQMNEAQEIKRDAKKLFADAQNQFNEFVVEKEAKLTRARNHSADICREYVKNTDEILSAKQEDFNRYLEQSHNEFTNKSREKIAAITYELVVEAIKYEKFSISNKLN